MADKEVLINDEVATVERDVDYYSGYLNYFPNPDPILLTEGNGTGLKLYEKIERDSHAFSVLQTRYLAVIGKEWEIIPANIGGKKNIDKTETREQIIADFVSKVLSNCNFDQMRQEILRAILLGYSVAEVIWKLDYNNQIVIEKFISKHPRRFAFTSKRELRLITPEALIEGIPVPEKKFIVFTYGDSDSPYGKGLGQVLYFPIWFKRHGVKFWMVFLEKFGSPTLIGKYPPGTLKGKQDDLMDALDALQTSSAVKIPETMTIELLEASRQGSASYESLCEYMDRQTSKTVLGQTLTSDTGKIGSLATARVHDSVRQEILEADADLLDSCLNSSIIKWLVDLNFEGVTEYPTLKTYATPKPNLTELSGIHETLITKVNLPVTKEHLYDVYGIPAPEPGEELVNLTDEVPITGDNKTQNLPESGDVKGQKFTSSCVRVNDKSFADVNRFSPGSGPTVLDALGENFLEELTQEGVIQAQNVFSNLSEKVQSLVEKGSSLEELRNTIFTEYNQLDTEALNNILVQTIIIARLHGIARGQDATDKSHEVTPKTSD